MQEVKHCSESRSPGILHTSVTWVGIWHRTNGNNVLPYIGPAWRHLGFAFQKMSSEWVCWGRCEQGQMFMGKRGEQECSQSGQTSSDIAACLLTNKIINANMRQCGQISLPNIHRYYNEWEGVLFSWTPLSFPSLSSIPPSQHMFQACCLGNGVLCPLECGDVFTRTGAAAGWFSISFSLWNQR